MNKDKKLLLVTIVVFIAFIVMFYQAYKINQLTNKVYSQNAVILEMQHGHEQTMLALYNHLTFCEYP